MVQDMQAEWLEADGRGGFASGTVSGERTRRYHALLLAAKTPPTGRVVLVNGIEAWVEQGEACTHISTQRYLGDVQHPDGWRGITAFSATPWPTWQFACGVTQEILVGRQGAGTVLRWRRTNAGAPARLCVRPLLSGRDYHALHRRNEAFSTTARIEGGNVGWHAYPDQPGVVALSNGTYAHDLQWYYDFLYSEEAAVASTMSRTWFRRASSVSTLLRATRCLCCMPGTTLPCRQSTTRHPSSRPRAPDGQPPRRCGSQRTPTLPSAAPIAR